MIFYGKTFQNLFLNPYFNGFTILTSQTYHSQAMIRLLVRFEPFPVFEFAPEVQFWVENGHF